MDERLTEIAAEVLRDPADAELFLKTERYDRDDGTVDTETFRTDLGVLADVKPHLARPAARATEASGSEAVDFRRATDDEVTTELRRLGFYRPRW